MVTTPSPTFHMENLRQLTRKTAPVPRQSEVMHLAANGLALCERHDRSTPHHHPASQWESRLALP